MKNFLFILSIIAAAATLALAAGAAGTWTLQGNAAGAPQQLVLGVTGTILSGTVDSSSVANGVAQDNTIHFQANRSGGTYNYKGTIVNGRLKLWETPPSGQGRMLVYTHPGN